MSRSKNVALAFLLGAFLVGGSLGFAMDRVMNERMSPTFWDQKTMLDWFAEDLGLDAKQKLAVDSILEERHKKIGVLMQPIRPSIDAIRDSSRAEIARMLTPAQRVKYDEYLQAERDRKVQKKDGR